MTHNVFKRIGRIIIGTIFAWHVCTCSQAATYYVSVSNGDDSKNGLSAEAAWKSVSKVNATRLSPGDAVLFARGGIWREELKVNGSGTSQQPIVIGAFGSGASPIFSGADLVISWQVASGTTYRASLDTEPFMVFVDDQRIAKGANESSLSNQEWFWSAGVLYLRSDSADPNAGALIEATQRTRGIGVWAKQYVELDGLHAEKASNTSGWGAGIVAYDGASHITIRNCTARQAGHSGIYCIGATHSTIESCTAYDNFYTGIFLVDGSSDSSVRRCIAFQNHYKGIDVEFDSNNVVVEDCLTYDNLREGLDTDAVTNVVFNRCIVYGNGRGVNGNGISVTRDATNVQFNYCVVFNNALHGIEIESGTGTRVTNCTLFKNGHYNIGIKSGNATVKNCILAEAAPGRQIAVYDSSGGATLDYNVYFAAAGFENSYMGTVYHDLAEWKSGTGQDAHSRIADPRFLNTSENDFHLSADSTCINSGIALGLSIDILGITIPQGSGVDIGAFEYVAPQAVDTTPPTPGAIIVPAISNAAPIVISYSGAADTGGSGLKRVVLWVKRGQNGAWDKTSIASTFPQGILRFTGVTGDMRYYFYLQAEDNAGNKSAIPTDAIVFGK